MFLQPTMMWGVTVIGNHFGALAHPFRLPGGVQLTRPSYQHRSPAFPTTLTLNITENLRNGLPSFDVSMISISTVVTFDRILLLLSCILQNEKGGGGAISKPGRMLSSPSSTFQVARDQDRYAMGS